MDYVLAVAAGFVVGITWPFGDQAVKRTAAIFSRDEHVRALRASNDKLASLLAESFSERWHASATLLHLQFALKQTTDQRDHLSAELALYRGQTASGAPIATA